MLAATYANDSINFPILRTLGVGLPLPALPVKAVRPTEVERSARASSALSETLILLWPLLLLLSRLVCYVPSQFDEAFFQAVYTSIICIQGGPCSTRSPEA